MKSKKSTTARAEEMEALADAHGIVLDLFMSR